jgi:hypothetical protein
MERYLHRARCLGKPHCVSKVKLTDSSKVNPSHVFAGAGKEKKLRDAEQVVGTFKLRAKQNVAKQSDQRP